MTSAAAQEDDEVFDAIVVGGGVAGTVCAYQLASQGHEVVLIERGDEPGAKNLSGGVFYCRVMEEVFPGFVEKAPVERRITRNIVSFLNEASSVDIDYWDQRLHEPANAVSVLRARVVVCADGVNSFLARQAGVRDKEPMKNLAVGVKSVIRLPRATIEDRFRLTEDDGIAYAIVGDATQGCAGGGFLYTNTESVSVGVVLRLDDLVAKGLRSSEVHDHFLAFTTDEEQSHIHVNQEIAWANGTGRLLVRVCPAHVYSEEPDGTISVEYAACLECGTCLAVAAPGALRWHYPRGGYGVSFREG